MPTRATLKKAGRSDLDSALNKHGGLVTVADHLGLGLSYTRKQLGYWNDFSNLRQALCDFVEAHGTPGVMPTQRELREGGQAALHAALDRHGGLLAVAHRLGLRYTSNERITSHTAETVERLARLSASTHYAAGCQPRSRRP
jgi:hypothetical protein